MTDAELLALIDAQITKVLQGAQEMTHNGKTIKLASLETLTKQRDRLTVRINRASTNRKVVRDAGNV